MRRRVQNKNEPSQVWVFEHSNRTGRTNGLYPVDYRPLKQPTCPISDDERRQSDKLICIEAGE